jgi:hypothetical protein
MASSGNGHNESRKIIDSIKVVQEQGGTTVSLEFFPAKTEEGISNLLARIEVRVCVCAELGMRRGGLVGVDDSVGWWRWWWSEWWEWMDWQSVTLTDPHHPSDPPSLYSGHDLPAAAHLRHAHLALRLQGRGGWVGGWVCNDD